MDAIDHDAPELIPALQDNFSEGGNTPTLTTRRALFFHCAGDRLALLTHHAVTPGENNEPVIMPGRPISPEDELALIDLLIGKGQKRGISVYPANLLSHDTGHMAWWMPPLVRPMHLRTPDGVLATIETRWPSLVGIVVNRKLYLVAVAGDQRPDASTPVFHCPLPNIYEDGSVCTGSAAIPNGFTLESLPEWDAVITGTAFTHTNHANTLREPEAKRGRGRKKPEARDADAAFWRERHGEDALCPEGACNPLGINLGDYLAMIAGPSADRQGHDNAF